MKIPHMAGDGEHGQYVRETQWSYLNRAGVRGPCIGSRGAWGFQLPPEIQALTSGTVSPTRADTCKEIGAVER